MKIDVLTLFPQMFPAVLEESILGRAKEKGLLDVKVTNIRDYSLNKHKKADEYPFGGGAGMVLTAQPVFDALRAIHAEKKRSIYLSPRGNMLDQKLITQLAQEEALVLLCGHYEGIDQRILDYWNMEEVSVGDYILTGGELPALVLIDAVARLVPHVLGSSCAHEEESVYCGLLEYPQYTKPREYEGMEVPEVLLSGNHKLIHLWKFEQSLRLTKERRPDLFAKFVGTDHPLSKEESRVLAKVLSDNL